MEQEHTSFTEEQITEHIELLKQHAIRLVGGYTTDTAWGYCYSENEQRFMRYHYDDEQNRVEEPASESDVIEMLKSFGKRVVFSMK